MNNLCSEIFFFVVAGIAANPLKQEATLVYMDQIIPLGSIINQMFSKTMQ